MGTLTGEGERMFGPVFPSLTAQGRHIFSSFSDAAALERSLTGLKQTIARHSGQAGV